MRQSYAAFALIRRVAAAANSEFLVNWNPGWNAFNLVGGKKERDESFRECCSRELQEELNLSEEVDYRVNPEPAVRLEEVKESQRTGELTAYTFEAFEVELLTEAARERVESDRKCP